MTKRETINKPVVAMQPAFAPAMFIDYRAQENTCGALIM
jgi:hypothetical protein